ncbi:unnamed protein product [Pneumocystis jirovecii]|uniref:G domain-containing protein n=1 Tax=Pneumocystis jirovecii TaxID=42068 RepID=L0PEY1_PNEJI|nr:unnamed protein product [Pneumocystis jirovecii]
MDILCGQLFAEDIQVAFVGRSNVSYMRRSLNTWFDAKMQKFRQVFRLYLNATGVRKRKSTCINFLTNQSLAKTSKKPGRTRSINGFIIPGKIGLVDLPGYGMGSREAWGVEIMKLRRVFVLIGSDCGFKETDRMMLSNLNDLGISYQILITKIDKLKKHPEALSALFFEAKNIIETYGSSGFPEILGIKCIQPVAGISNLRWAILRACGW